MGLSKDFTGLSELLLGQAQPAQFQSSGQTGYVWGALINADREVLDGTNTSSGSFARYLDGVWIEDREETAMPRSYNGLSSYGNIYYSWAT